MQVVLYNGHKTVLVGTNIMNSLLSDGTFPCVCQVWVGTTKGVIFICDVCSYQLVNKLASHTDQVRAVSVATGQFVFTVAGQSDGRIVVWRWPTNQPTASPAKH